MIWSCKLFNQLNLNELYEIMNLRQVVFIVEQNCPYLDADGKDIPAWHLMGRDAASNQLIAYTRLLPKGVAYEMEISIGRVVTHPKVRNTGAGKALMTESLKQIRALYPNQPIRIGAQCYLIPFYEGFGFKIDGEAYLEDGILHIEMILSE
jgi:ElaA protein